MKIKILKACMVAGKMAEKGDTVDVPDSDAKYLIHAGRAAAVDKKAEKPAAKTESTKA